MRLDTLQTRSSFQGLLTLSCLNAEAIWINPQEEVPISLCVCRLGVLNPVLLEHCPALATCLPESVVFFKSSFVGCRIMNKLTMYTPVKVFACEGKVSTSMNEGQSLPAQPSGTYQLRSCHSLNWCKLQENAIFFSLRKTHCWDKGYTFYSFGDKHIIIYWDLVWTKEGPKFKGLLFSRLVVSDSLQPHVSFSILKNFFNKLLFFFFKFLKHLFL